MWNPCYWSSLGLQVQSETPYNLVEFKYQYILWMKLYCLPLPFLMTDLFQRLISSQLTIK